LLFDDYGGRDKNNMRLKEEVVIYGDQYIDGSSYWMMLMCGKKVMLIVNMWIQN
jgi:hypothetical protein